MCAICACVSSEAVVLFRARRNVSSLPLLALRCVSLRLVAWRRACGPQGPCSVISVDTSRICASTRKQIARDTPRLITDQSTHMTTTTTTTTTTTGTLPAVPVAFCSRSTRGPSAPESSTLTTQLPSSPLCGYNMTECVEFRGEDLSCYFNKIQSTGLRACPYQSINLPTKRI